MLGPLWTKNGIVELLRSEGVDIARRTVAKYRAALRIPPSDKRRRTKQRALAKKRRHGGGAA